MKEFEKHNVVLLVLTIAAHISNYFFQIIMGRMLDIAHFGILNSLSSLYAIVSVPVLIILMVVSKYVSEYKALDKAVDVLLKKVFVLVFVFSICYTLIGMGLSGFIASFLNIEDTHLVFFIIVAAGFALLLPVAMGALQGGKNFFAFGIVGLVFPLTRLFTSAIFVFFGLELNGIVLSFILGNVFAILIGMWLLRFNFSIPIGKLNLRGNFKALQFVWLAFLVNIGMTILINVDIILVKHFFMDEATGFYSVASILGKIIIFVSSSVIWVMFPFAVEATARKNDASQILKKALLYGGGLSVFYAIGLNIFARLAITILFGSRYLESVVYIFPISIWTIAVSFIFILANYSLAINRAKFLSYSLLIGCVIGLVLIYFFHDTILQIVYILAAISFGILIMGVVSIFMRHGKPYAGLTR